MAVQIVQLELHTICAGQLCVNVLHFMGDTAETNKFIIARDMVRSFDLTDTNPGFDANKYMAAMSDQCFLSSVVARVVGLSPGPKYPKLYAAVDFIGQISAQMYSQQVAANFKFVTASGPDFTGRMFYPGVPDDYLVENRWTTDYVDLATTLMSDINAGIDVGAVNFDLCVYNRTTKTAEDVTNIALSPNPGTIRKRLSPV